MSCPKELEKPAIQNLVDQDTLAGFIFPRGHASIYLETVILVVSKRITAHKLPITVVIVNAVEYVDLAAQHEVTVLPALKFFRNGRAITYLGARNPDDIWKWLIEKIYIYADITGPQEADDFIGSHPMCVIGIFRDTQGKFFL